MGSTCKNSRKRNRQEKSAVARARFLPRHSQPERKCAQPKSRPGAAFQLAVRNRAIPKFLNSPQIVFLLRLFMMRLPRRGQRHAKEVGLSRRCERFFRLG
jgi:hypothetical protein